MKCSRCGLEVCYFCNMVIDGYDHFNKHKICPLYSDKKVVNENKSKKAALDFYRVHIVENPEDKVILDKIMLELF